MNFKLNRKTFWLSMLALIGISIGGYFIYKNLPKTSVSANEDVRNKNLSRCTIKDETLLRSLFFNENTIFPDSTKLPDNIGPKQILEDSKYPGMGIKDLHNQGITGKNVHVAILDQTMGKSLDHPEYKDSIAEFKSFFPENIINSRGYSGTSFHGPFVTSLLAGKNTGVAPDVKVHYMEIPMGSMSDAKYFADALDYIIEKNKSLSKDEQIRIVSVSEAPSATVGNTIPNGDLWEDAFNRARENGILVFDTKDYFQCCYLDYNNVDDISKCFLKESTITGLKDNQELFISTKRDINSIYDLICIPSGCRTFAEVNKPGEYSYCYQYPSESGTIPILSGILALGLQVNPDISNDELIQTLKDTCYTQNQGFKIINPKNFIQKLYDK